MLDIFLSVIIACTYNFMRIVKGKKDVVYSNMKQEPVPFFAI